MKLNREFYIPAGSSKVSDRQSDAVAYTYANANNQPCAALFIGKRSKPEWRYRFRSEGERATRIADGFNSRRATLQYKANRKAELAAKGRGVEVGHILVSSWGYDQTNIDFYEVTKLIGNTMAEIRKIGQIDAGNGNEPWMTGKCVPDAGNYIGAAKRVKMVEGRCSINGYTSAYVWDGQPRSWTSYA